MTLSVGDIIMSRPDADPMMSVGHVFLNEKWIPVSFEPNATFVVIESDKTSSEVLVVMVSLICGQLIWFKSMLTQLAACCEVITRVPYSERDVVRWSS